MRTEAQYEGMENVDRMQLGRTEWPLESTHESCHNGCLEYCLSDLGEHFAREDFERIPRLS